MTQGVSDVLSEAAIESLISRAPTSRSQSLEMRTIRFLIQERAALASHCAEQDAEIESVVRGAMAWESAGSKALDRAKEAEARCLELEAALRDIEWNCEESDISRHCFEGCSVSFGCPVCGHSEREGHSPRCTLAEVLARATLTPTVEMEPLCSHCQFCSCGCHAPAVVETEETQ